MRVRSGPCRVRVVEFSYYYQEPGSAPEPHARQSSMVYVLVTLSLVETVVELSTVKVNRVVIPQQQDEQEQARCGVVIEPLSLRYETKTFQVSA